MKRSSGFVAWAAVSIAVSGCFPDELIGGSRDASADVQGDVVTKDVVTKDDGGLDAGDLDAAVTDVPVVDVPATPTDVPVTPTDVDFCAMVPRDRVPAMPVFAVQSGARDLAFDGRGGVALTAASRINLVAGGGSATPLVEDAMGEVTALRYTASGQLVFAASSLTDAGNVSGRIFVLEPGSTTPTTRWSPTGRVDGLAVNPDGSVWYSDRTANTVYRLSVGDPAMPEALVTGVPAPRSLAFDATGRVLYVGGGGGVYRVNLDGEDGGVGGARLVFTGTDTVTGLAVDVCGNLWVADERPAPATSRLLRWDGAQFSVIYESADGVRAIAFGQGGGYDDRVLYFIQATAGAVRAVGVVARGVVRPAPTP